MNNEMVIKMKMSDRINKRMKLLNLKQSAIVRLSGVAKSSVSQYTNGITTPHGDNLIRIAKALKTSPGWLVSGKGREDITQIGNNDFSELMSTLNKYPLLKWSDLLKRRQFLDSSNYIMDAEMIVSPYTSSDDSFVLVIENESMLDEFKKGDMVLVDPAVNAANGSFVIAQMTHKQDAIIRQLVVDNGEKFLKCINPDWPNRFVPIGANDVIIGTVVGKWKKYI